MQWSLRSLDNTGALGDSRYQLMSFQFSWKTHIKLNSRQGEVNRYQIKSQHPLSLRNIFFTIYLQTLITQIFLSNNQFLLVNVMVNWSSQTCDKFQLVLVFCDVLESSFRFSAKRWNEKCLLPHDGFKLHNGRGGDSLDKTLIYESCEKRKTNFHSWHKCVSKSFLLIFENVEKCFVSVDLIIYSFRNLPTVQCIHIKMIDNVLELRNNAVEDKQLPQWIMR